jgi:outer membrane protein assembly factor BamB/PKD repeat protein
MNQLINKTPIIIVLLLFLALPVQAADVMFRANPQHTGVYDTSETQPNNVLKWSFDQQNNQITAPAVAGGVVYFGSNDKNLYALYAANGTEKWRFATGNMILSAPAVADGIVYFGCTDRKIYAVNAVDGSLRWQVATNSTWDSGIGTSSPAVSGGTVYIVSFDKNLYAINADTGAVRWTFPFQPLGSEPGSSPAVADGIVYFGDMNRVFYAVNATDGAERWRYTGPGGISSSPPPVPVVSDGVLYVPGPGPHNLTAFYAVNGTVKFQLSRGYLTNWELVSPAVANGVIYTGGADLNLYAIDAASGEDLWSFPLGALLRASPSVSDGVIYAPSMNKILYAIYTQNGTEKWRFSPPNNRGLWGGPVITDGVVYIDGDGADHFYAVGNQGTAPLFFTGRVYAGITGNISSPGLRDVPVRLYGSELAGDPGTLVDYTVTDSYGYYLLPVPATQYQFLNIIHEDPIPGSTPAGASSTGGSVKNTSWIQYGTLINGTDLTGNNFWDYVPVVHGDFSGTPLQGTIPLTVEFTDNSTGYPTIWNWVPDYDISTQNGLITSTSRNCTYTYDNPGQYNVQMRVFNAVSSDWVTKIAYINVSSVSQPPVVSGITPCSAELGTSIQITNLSGNNFEPGAGLMVNLTRAGQNTIAAGSIIMVSPNVIQCTIDIPVNASTGPWNVVVTNPDGQSGTLPGGFMITGRQEKIGVFRDGFWILDYNGNYQWSDVGTGNDLVAGFGMAGDKPVIGNWDHTTPGDKIGVFRNGTWLIDYNGNFQWDGVDKSAYLGQAGDLPVIGDWNNNGDKKIGVFRNGFWMLDGNGNYNWDGPGTDLDVVAGFGQTGDIPVVGKWDAAGQDKIGVFRNGFWILDYSGNYQWNGLGTGNDLVAGFGSAGDVPIVRDWNGDGRSEIAVFRASAGQWLIDYNGNYIWDGTGAGQDVSMYLGQNVDIAIAGDWNSNGKDKLGVFRDGFWIIEYNGNYQWDGPPDDKVSGFGMTGDIPVPGNYR